MQHLNIFRSEVRPINLDNLVPNMPTRQMDCTYGSVATSDQHDEIDLGDSIPLCSGRTRKASIGVGIAIGTLLLGAVVTMLSRKPDLSDSDDPTAYANLSSLAKASPEEAFGFLGVERADGSDPSPIWGDVKGPYPTNSWYLNLVSHKSSVKPDEIMSRVYTTPYVIDVAPPNDMAGIRVHWPVIKASANNIQMVYDYNNGVSMGTTDVDASYLVDEDEGISDLSLSLKWGDKSDKAMVTHIVRGMPYSTTRYYGGALPVLYSDNAPNSQPLVDGEAVLDCEGGGTVTVEKEIQLHFRNSDFTWAVFFSKPVEVSCEIIGDDIKLASFELSIIDYEIDDEPLTTRIALIDPCTTGKSDITEHCSEKNEWKDPDGYVALLRERVGTFPTSPTIDFEYPGDDVPAKEREVKMTIDWKATSSSSEEDEDEDDLIMFALPHHQEDLADTCTTYCIPTFHGKTCLVEGSSWTLTEDISTPVSFTAGRPPEAETIPALVKALKEDINYRLSDNMLRGAADTYFSGKILARLGRVIAIASELRTLAEGSVETTKPLYDDNVEDDFVAASIKAAANADLPSEIDISKAVTMLSKGVEIWLTTDAEATYVYDKSWGGFVNCGCKYKGKGQHGYCSNHFPDECPALEDVNEDFGNGFYNDHHFHYGYHLYAAGVVAKHDPVWAAKTFDRVLLYVRDIANPLADDEYFPQFRQKDWYLGSSWAAGIVSAENSPHGRNQESSSEAIAAYEGVALWGAAVYDAGIANNLELAKLVRDAGQLLTMTELRATKRYWHVWSNGDHTNSYPSAYTKLVVGMMYETQASFQTWFAPYAVVSYGIQLLPLTPIAEYRDDPEWAAELYPLYKESCESAGDYCTGNGWSILQAGLLATTGSHEKAINQALEVPKEVFATDGGIGNSLSNTLWFIATRKPVDLHA